MSSYAFSFTTFEGPLFCRRDICVPVVSSSVCEPWWWWWRLRVLSVTANSGSVTSATKRLCRCQTTRSRLSTQKRSHLVLRFVANLSDARSHSFSLVHLSIFYLPQLACHSDTINEICFSPASPHLLFSASSDFSVKANDIRTKTGAVQEITLDSEIWSIGLGCGGSLLGCGTVRTTFIDIRQGKIVRFKA